MERPKIYSIKAAPFPSSSGEPKHIISLPSEDIRNMAWEIIIKMSFRKEYDISDCDDYSNKEIFVVCPTETLEDIKSELDWGLRRFTA